MGVPYVIVLFVMTVHPKYARATPDPEAGRWARTAGRRLIEVQIEVVQRLEDMNEGYAFAALGCSSIGHYGMTLGLSQKQARMLADAGRAFAIAPDLEEEVRVGAVTIEGARPQGTRGLSGSMNAAASSSVRMTSASGTGASRSAKIRHRSPDRLSAPAWSKVIISPASSTS